jgi:preprotein translocase subunit SecD
MMRFMTWRVWLLLGCILASLLAIGPSFSREISITGVQSDSAWYTEGIRDGQTLYSIDDSSITSVVDFGGLLATYEATSTPRRVDVVTDAGTFIVYTNESLSFGVKEAPRTNIHLGLDLAGGARALVQPEENLDDASLQDLIAISRNRLNVYGLSDVQLKGVRDAGGQAFMLVEIAGATPGDLQELIGQQGKSAALIGNTTVFTGGKEDIGGVCTRDATCAGIRQCLAVQGGYACEFQFALYFTEQAAKRHADVTRSLSTDSSGQYLSEQLVLTVDGKEATRLSISTGLRGLETREISISGSGTGATQDAAYAAAQEEMHRLQTILLTGSLPYALTIVKLDTISPALGKDFLETLLLAGGMALLGVSIIVFLRYRAWKASLAVLITSFSEVIIILGIAALMGWHLDLPSIAGILATIGTSVDQQIVILDESRKRAVALAERMKRALFIVVSAFATSAASLLPLYWAGAGLFKGFMITTLIGITAGVLISRPAFSDLMAKLEGED